MLLDHTSDLNDFFFNPRIDHALQSNPDATWTAKRTWRYVPPGPIRPGKVWAYSNTNYMVLGELVKAITGHSLAKEVRDPVARPARVSTTRGTRRPRIRRPTLSTGYRLVPTANGARPVPVAPASDVMPFRSVVTAAGGAGSIAATAEDTARWMQAFAGGKVLSPAMQAAMLGDVARTRGRSTRAITYGLGIQLVADRRPRGARALRPLPRLSQRRALPAARRASRSRC